MTFRSAVLLVCASFMCVPAGLRAQNDATAATAAAYVLALGRMPSAAELASEAASGSVADALARLAQRIKTDDGLKREAAFKAWVDATGRRPTEAELSEPAQLGATYTELLKQHISRLAAQPEEYEAVVRRAYPLVIHREVYPEEITYWKKQGPLPFVLVVAGVEDWARRNQPGLMVTTGVATVSVNSEYLVTVRLSPAVAAEACTAAGLAVGDSTTDGAHHLVAAGGEKLVTGGGIYFVAAGRPDLVQ